MKHTADVVVIGAGIQGLSAAYHLAKIGVTDVVIVEKEFIGAGSSGRSASMIMLQVDTEPKIRLSQYCFERYMIFEEELGTDPEYRPIGYLNLATAPVADALSEQIELRRKLGVRVDALTPEDIKAFVPVVNTDDLVLGAFGPEDGIIEAQSIMLGYKDGMNRLGGKVYQGVRASGIQVEGDHVTGVETTSGLISAPFVVNAAGADAAEVGHWVGIDLPIDNRSRSIFVTDKFPLIPDDTPFVHDAEVEWYYRKEGPGVLMGMGKESGKSVSMSINREFLPQVIEAAIHRVPALAEARIASGWSGFRPLTPDYRAIIGPVDGLDGYINLCGWGGEGVMHAPAGGQLVAEIIHDGQATTFNLAPFLFSRFAMT